ncbi:MAG: histidinol-phosphatase HisJ family protein, partial [Candidatus Dormibacteria bacterium]
MTQDSRGPEADLHLHSQFSWDATQGSMEESCRHALDLGLKVIAFTDHADRAESGGAELQISGYRESIALCRRRFPRLNILSGVELGEPHRFPDWAQGVLAEGDFDVVLGSVHCVEMATDLVECSHAAAEGLISPRELIRGYFAELMRLLQSPVEFGVLAHLEYPKRYWRSDWPPYRTSDYREEIQAVLEAAAGRGVILEFNTTSGWDPRRGLCPAPEVIHWWREAGGRAVSMGSDAHRPNDVGNGLNLARQVLEAAGFTPIAATIPLWATPPGSNPSGTYAVPGSPGS